MANMTVNQRNHIERIELSVPSTGVAVKNRRAVAAFSALAIAVFGALAYATVEAIDGWAQGVVLAMIVVTTIGAMIAIDPLRRA